MREGELEQRTMRDSRVGARLGDLEKDPFLAFGVLEHARVGPEVQRVPQGRRFGNE